MEKPTASIVIVNYNGGQHLGECLAAVHEKSDVAFEVIVVDNASTDGSASDLSARYPSLKLIASDVNAGYARGINAGLGQARGDFIVILNMDIVVEHGWLSPLIEFLKEHPDAGAVAPCMMLYEDPEKINALGQNVHVTGLGFNRKLNWPSQVVDPTPVRVSGVQGGAFALRTDEFRQLGGMNEHYFLYHEDVEISFRLALAGYRIFTVPAAVVRHKYVLHMTPEKLHWLERHRWLTVLGTYHAMTILLLTPFLFLTEALMAIYCLSRGRAFIKAKAQAIHWVLSNLTELNVSRRKIQAVRRVSDRQLLLSLHWRYNWDQFLSLAQQRGGWLRETVSGVFARRAHDRAA